jgi:DNA-binding response OmpR family regulator
MAPRVLVVDDDEEMREILAFKLEPEYEVDTATDGQEGWTYLAERLESPPDLVVLDIMMPKMDGFRVLDRIADEPMLDGVAVVVLTSRGREEDVVRALDAGATDYVTKPFAPDELAARIERALR